MIFKKLCLLATAISLSLLTACLSVPSVPTGPEPGTVGFYDIKPRPSRVATEDLIARRMSNPGDKLFVYRLNTNMVSIGEGNPKADAKIVPLDEASRGTIITPDAARRLSVWLEKIVAAYDNKGKTNSQYFDFRVYTNGEVKTIIGTDGSTEIETEYITVRFQYVFNYGAENDGEVIYYYLGGSGRPRMITYNEIKILISNLQKT